MSYMTYFTLGTGHLVVGGGGGIRVSGLKLSSLNLGVCQHMEALNTFAVVCISSYYNGQISV